MHAVCEKHLQSASMKINIHILKSVKSVLVLSQCATKSYYLNERVDSELKRVVSNSVS